MFRWWNSAFISPDTVSEQKPIIFKTLKEGFCGNSTGQKSPTNQYKQCSRTQEFLLLSGFIQHLSVPYFGDYTKQCRYTVNKTEYLPSRDMVF